MFIVTAKEMYDIDHFTMKEIGLSGKLLMENAGREIFQRITALVQSSDVITVLIGAGNNGGDGFVIARYLFDYGYHVRAVQIAADEKVTGDADYHKQIFLRSGASVQHLTDTSIDEIVETSDVLVDAILGIGLKGKLRAPFLQVIETMNQSSCLVVSVDIPSGLPADEEGILSVAVKADYTFAVGAIKLSAFLHETAHFYGKWEIVDIGFSQNTMEAFSGRKHYSLQDFKKALPQRKRYAHKGDHGKGLLIGGSAAMPGSITMASQAALVTGAGLLTAATLKNVVPTIAARSPEAMFYELPESQGQLTDDGQLAFDAFDAVAIGVGMGRNEQAGHLVKRVLQEADYPVIIDADGLYHLKNYLHLLKERKYPTIITPHTGEMARLLGITTEELLKKPFHYAKEFASIYHVYVLLKGKYTIITHPDLTQVVDSTGNPGLAKGGSGDVLTGIALAMIMQKQSLFHALCNACFLHGTAADQAVAANHSVYDLVATDIISAISGVYRMVSI